MVIAVGWAAQSSSLSSSPSAVRVTVPKLLTVFLSLDSENLMVATQNAKRKRVEDEEAPIKSEASTPAAFKRGDVWFEDGNVIIIATGNVGFKVSTGSCHLYTHPYQEQWNGIC